MGEVLRVRGVEDGLAEEPGPHGCGDRGERALHPRGGPHEGERKPDERARHEHAPARVREQHRIGREPVDDPPGVGLDLRDPRVVAEHARRPEREREQHRRREQPERQPEPRHDPPDVPVLDDECRDHERGRQHDVLDPRERGQPTGRDERNLRATRRLVQHAHRQVDRCQRQRIRDRLREHEGDVEEVRRHDREEPRAEREPFPEPDSTAQEIDRHGCERHGQRVQALRQAIGELRVAEQPERRGEDRLEQRRKVRRAATDDRAPGLGDAARQRRVDVLVGQVERGRVREREQESDAQTGCDDAGEHEARRHRREAKESQLLCGRGLPRGEVECHALRIGKTAL